MKSPRLARSLPIIVIVVMSTTAVTCQPKLTTSPAAFVKALQDQGWTYADPPRGILGPGSIVTVTSANGIKYRSDLSTCISDPAVLKTKEGKVAISGTLSGSTDWDISALVGYQGINIGPEFSDAKSFSLTLKSATEQALDTYAISNWIKKNQGSLSDACAAALVAKPGESGESGGVYVLTDVLRVDGYKYTFHNAAGASVSLPKTAIAKLTLNLKGSYKVGSDGDIEVSDGALYIAFQKDISTQIGAAGAVAAPSAVDIMNQRNATIFTSK